MADKMKKPKHKCGKPTLKRDHGYVFKAEWKVPKAALAAKRKYKDKNGQSKETANEYRFTYLLEKFRVNEHGVKTKKDPTDLDKQKKESDTSDAINLDNFKTTRGKQFTRQSFYPKGKKKVDSLVFSVCGANSAGQGDWVSQTYKFKLPRAPKVSWSYDAKNGKATVTVETDAGTDSCERYDTVVRTAVKAGSGKEKPLLDWTPTTNTKWTATYDTSSSNYPADFAAGETLEFRCWAYARGLKGDNPAQNKAVYGKRLIAAPSAASINSVTTSAKDATGRIRVGITVGANTASVKLERRIGESGSWGAVDGAEDNGTCTALYDSYGDVDPSPGEYVYYRVVSTRDNFTVTSKPYKATKLYTAAATAASSTIKQAAPRVGDDGTSAVAQFGWSGNPNEKGKSGVEVSWSQNADAWESTDQPETFEAEWQDGSSKYSGQPYSMSVIIRGLPQSETTYIRGRKYLEGDNGRTWSGYSNTQSVTPAARPASVTLEAPPSVVRGQAIDIMWTFDGDSEQKEWHVFDADNPKSPIAEGKDAKGVASIPASAYGDKAAVTLFVMIGSGGDLTRSTNDKTVEISEPLTCEIHRDATLASMADAQFDAYANQPGCLLVCNCINVGNIGPSRPDGGGEQFDGDTVWTDYVSPSWEQTTWEATPYADGRTGTVYHATVAMAQDTDFIDNAGYRVAVRAVKPTKGLESPDTSASFTVKWTHQAPEPSDDIALMPNVDDRTVTVTLVPPAGAAEGDVYDVYRGHASGYDLVRSGLKLDDVFTDRFATFSDGGVSYRIATRTADGDTSWDEYYYELPCEVTRFDWPGGSAEFGRSLNFRDSFRKSFSRRPHKDGTVGGAFNPAIERTGSYDCKVIKGIDADDLNALLAMAEYPNAVYCRRPDGHAFQCNVDIDLGNRDWSMLEDVSFSVDRFTLTEQFMVQPGDIVGAVADETQEAAG